MGILGCRVRQGLTRYPSETKFETLLVAQELSYPEMVFNFSLPFFVENF